MHQPAGHLIRVVFEQARCDRRARGDVGELRASDAEAFVSPNGVTGDTGLGLEELPALRDQMRIFVLLGELLLFPVIERRDFRIGVPFISVAVFVGFERGELSLGNVVCIGFVEFDGAGR